MFECNEDLFLMAAKKIKESEQLLLSKKANILRLDDLTSNFEFGIQINEIVNEISKIQNTISELLIDLGKALLLLQIDENELIGKIFSNSLNDKYGTLEFLNYGQYGANQSGPWLLMGKFFKYNTLSDIEKHQFDDLMNVFMKNSHLVDDAILPSASMHYFMEKFANIGCGFAAGANIIVDIYSNRENGEKLFEEKYGFPLYYEEENGERYYNYDALLASYYLNCLSNDMVYQLQPGMIEYPEWYPSTLKLGYRPDVALMLSPGTNGNTRATMFKHELDDMQIDYQVVNDISLPDYIDEYNNHDYLILSVRNAFVLRDYDATNPTSSSTSIQIGSDRISDYERDFYYDGHTYLIFEGDVGHAMLVTGITEDGKFIVTSWGGKYVLEYAECANMDLIDVRE